MSKRRDAAQLARDRRRIAEMYLHGVLQADIADELHIDQSTVSRDLKALQDEWRASSLVDINEAKARELARIDELERTYWEGWERSKRDAETKRSRATDVPGKGRQYEVDTTVEGQTGDPRFLDGVQRCIERRCRLLGIDAPSKVSVFGSKTEAPIQTERVYDDTRLDRILDILKEAGALEPYDESDTDASPE